MRVTWEALVKGRGLKTVDKIAGRSGTSAKVDELLRP
jgi:hypothetical protein